MSDRMTTEELIEKRVVVRQQFDEAVKAQHVTCQCGKRLPLHFVFRCYYCGEFFCPACAPRHFGKTREEYFADDGGKSGEHYWYDDEEVWLRFKNVDEELVHIDHFPNQCGFFTSDTEENNGYGCTFPAEMVEGGFKKCEPGRCFGWDCPFANEADLDDLKKHDPHLYVEYKDEEHGPEETGSGWLIKYREIDELITCGEESKTCPT